MVERLNGGHQDGVVLLRALYSFFHCGTMDDSRSIQLQCSGLMEKGNFFLYTTGVYCSIKCAAEANFDLFSRYDLGGAAELKFF